MGSLNLQPRTLHSKCQFFGEVMLVGQVAFTYRICTFILIIQSRMDVGFFQSLFGDSGRAKKKNKRLLGSDKEL